MIPGANTEAFTPSFGGGAADNLYYKRQVTNADISEFSNEVVLTLVANPTITIAATGQPGSTINIPIGASVQLNANASGQPISSYVWSPSTSLNTSTGSTVTATPNSQIVYTVTGTTASNCQATGQITINATALDAGAVESSSTSSANEAICIGATPSVMQPAGASTPTGGSGTYTYQWQRSRDNITWTDITAANNNSFSNTTYTTNSSFDSLYVPRFYRRKAIDMGIEAFSNSINISIKLNPTIVATTDKVNVPTGGNVTLSATGGANANSYTWYKQGTQIGTAQSFSIAVPLTSRYVVYGVGANSCGDSSSVSISAVPLTPGSIGVDQSMCINGTPQTINNITTASGGSGTYTYKWWKTTDLSTAFTEISGATQTSYTPTGVTTTTYYKRQVVDSDITDETGVVTVTVVPNPTVDITTGNRYMPPGGSITLNATGASTYSWSPTVVSQNASNSQVLVNGAGAGTTNFTAQGTDINGCIGSDTINITVRNITTGTIGTNETICEGTIPATMSGPASTGGSGIFTYQWQNSTDNATWSDLTGEVSENLVFSSTYSATTYFRRKTIDQSIEALSNTITLSASPKPTLTISTNTGGNNLCAGADMILTVQGATTYTWTQGSTALGTNQSITVSPSTTTTYSVIGTSSQGCISDATTISISVTPAPVVLAATDYSQIPPGATVNLSATGANTYSWTPTNGLSTSTGSAVTATPASTTRYIVTGTNADGCSDTISQLIKVVPLDGGSITTTKSVCSGDFAGSIQETASSDGGTGAAYTYEWEKSSDNINWTVIPNTNSVSSNLNEVVTQTTYFRRKTTNFTVSAYSNICTVQPLGLPTVVVTTDKSTVPRGGQVTFSAAGAVTYDLKLNSAVIATVFPYQTQVFNTSTYSLEGTDANGCVDTGQVVVTVQSILPGSIGPGQTDCEGSTFNAVQNLGSPTGGSGVYYYQWEASSDGSNYTVIASTNSLNYSPGILGQTTYYRRRVFDSGMDTVSAFVGLTVNSDPQVNAVTATKTVPPGASITLNGTGAVTYLWTGAQSSNLSSTTGSPVTALINTSTSYIVTGTDANGCQDTGKVSIIVVPINPGSTDGTVTVCYGEVPPQIFSTALASGGSENFSYEWETSSDGITWTLISGCLLYTSDAADE